MVQRAILLVSFGTIYEDARRDSMDMLEKYYNERFHSYEIYQGWTSAMIRRAREKRNLPKIDSVSEAFYRMASDGVREVIVQPTFVVDGPEYDRLIAEVNGNTDLFAKITIAHPLMVAKEEILLLADVLEEIVARATEKSRMTKERIEIKDIRQNKETREDRKESVLVIGHGAKDSDTNKKYRLLETALNKNSDRRWFLGLLDKEGSFEEIYQKLTENHLTEITMMPLMFAAGGHVRKDIFGDSADSWKSRLKTKGIKVKSVPKGLGEYVQIRELYEKHTKEVYLN